MKAFSIFAAAMLMTCMAVAQAHARGHSAGHAPSAAYRPSAHAPSAAYHPSAHAPQAYGHPDAHAAHGHHHPFPPRVFYVNSYASYDYYSADTAPAEEGYDYKLAASQAALNLAEAQRLQAETAREQANAAAAERDAAKARRAKEFEIRRQKNAERAQAQARLSGNGGADRVAPVAIAWPADLRGAKFAGYRRLVERATALQAAGNHLTGDERRRLVRAHDAVLTMLRNHASEDGDVAQQFVEGLQAGRLPHGEVTAAE